MPKLHQGHLLVWKLEKNNHSSLELNRSLKSTNLMLCVLSVWFYRSLRFNYIMKEDDWLGETLEKRLELRTNEDCHDHHHLHFAVSITLCQLSQSWAYLHPSCMIAWSSVDEDPPPPSRSMFALGVRWSVADPWLTRNQGFRVSSLCA